MKVNKGFELWFYINYYYGKLTADQKYELHDYQNNRGTKKGNIGYNKGGNKRNEMSTNKLIAAAVSNKIR